MHFLRVLISISLICCGLQANAGAAAKTVNLVTAEWVPYVIANQQQHGYAYDVVQAAFEAVGYKVTIKLLPWHEALDLAEKGASDAIFPEYYSLSRSKYFEFSNPFLAGPLVFYKKASSAISLQGLDPNQPQQLFMKLKAYRFGVVAGYSNVPIFDKNTQLTKITVKTDRENLQQLYEGKVDLILIDKLNAQYILRYELPSKYNETLVALTPPIRQNNVYVAFSKAKFGYHALVTDFNTGLQQIQSESLTNRLMSHYIYEFIDRDAAPKKLNTLD